MPSQLPASFASAASTNTGNEGGSTPRNTGGSGDWSRARTNGATQTFRRPSLASNTANPRDGFQSGAPTPTTGVYVPPHLNSNYQPTFSRNSGLDCRYSKEQILELFRSHEGSTTPPKLLDVLTEGWSPNVPNSASNGTWSRRDDYKDGNLGPEICWDHDGSVHPLGTIVMHEDEKELFATSVNSPLKPPPQNGNKEGTPTTGINGRKSSISQMQTGLGTPLQSGRPGPRRRETSDSLTSNPLASPTTFNRNSKDEAQTSTAPSLIRRRTDFKDAFGPSLGKSGDKSDAMLDANSPFGSFKRTTMGPQSAGIGGPSSPWSSAAPQSAGFPPMGAFGSFALEGNAGNPSTPGEKRAGFGNIRGESRFKGLMSKEIGEDASGKLKSKASVSSLEKLPETDPERPSSKWGPGRSMLPESREVNAFGDLKQITGSAALGGDESSPQSQHSFYPHNSGESRPHDDIGFSSFAAPTDKQSFRDMMQQQTPQSHQYSGNNPYEPMSPTNTNPYQSPEGDKSGTDAHDEDPYGNPGNAPRTFNAAYDGGASDRSHTSSAGPSRNYPALGGLGSLGSLGASGNWSAAPGTIGSSMRSNQGFTSGYNDPIFGSMGDLQSSGNGAFGTHSANFGNIGAIGRGSKMGSLFPAPIQDQMRTNDQNRPEHGYGDSRDASLGRNSANAPGFGAPLRESDSPSRHQRGMLDDLFGNLDGRGRTTQSETSPFGGSEGIATVFSSAQSQPQVPFPTASAMVDSPSAPAPSSSSFGRSQDQDPNTSSQIQQRQMVMPDRMRWIYRDPQGTIQGPWSGLEMHDWYKAGFFSPELQVKKLEDYEYEPLAQLIRRIGNSREPFLVPQIGIPHGAASTQPTNNGAVLATAAATTPGIQAGSAQPPFASSFPSFGTTLTAEQQNALERRKQEEQYLMARQKEHLAQQQVMHKQMQHMQGGPHALHSQQLHHHSSAHSLQSQPSYGSITSPAAYQQALGQGSIPQAGPISGFFDPQTRLMGPSLGGVGHVPDGMQTGRDSDMAASLERLSVGRTAQSQFSAVPHGAGQQEVMSHKQQVAAMVQARSNLQREQEQHDQMQRDAQQDSAEGLDRLEQYQRLRLQDNYSAGSIGGIIGRPSGTESADYVQGQDYAIERIQDHGLSSTQEQDETSPIQQNDPTFGQSPAAVPTQSPWATVEAALPQPFPPPQSASPLPAPAAQRNRQHVADALAAESRSRSQTPSVENSSSSLAPWAKENLDGPKGPSLKEIQEVEARRTAELGVVAAASRRAIAEQERQVQLHTSIPAPGLPSSANWASGGSPATPTASGPSAWAKPLAGKPTSSGSAGVKKGLSQIQKEEEARKNRAAAAAAALNAANSASVTTSIPGGKRYADLAARVASPPAGSGAWTTVGAGGKLKSPGPPTAPVPATKSIHSGAVSNVITIAKTKASNLPSRSNTGGASSANDEFQKWARIALAKGLHTSINVDDFVRNLMQLPSEPEILSEAVYACSQTLDGRRFAEEFIRRRKLADRGVIPEASANVGFSSANSGEGKSGGGWSEVAKKGPPVTKDEPSSAFKVVAAKKKGGKRG